EFRRIKGRVTILLADVTGNGDPDVFPGNLGEALAVHAVAVEADLLVFDGRSPTTDVRVGCKTRSARAQRLSEHRADLVGIDVDLSLSLWALRGGRRRLGGH